MVDTSTTSGGRGAIGSQQQGNVTYNVMPEQIVKQLQSNQNAEFIVIQRVRQGEEPKLFSTGDPTQAQQLFRQAYTNLAFDKEHAST